MHLYCIKTAEPIIKQSLLNDSIHTPVFSRQKSLCNYNAQLLQKFCILCQKMSCYNFNKHEVVLIVFVVYVTEKVSNYGALFFNLT